MYAKWGSMEDAHSAFQGLRHPDAVCWNALISGYAEKGKASFALDLFARMEEPDPQSFVAALKACIEIGNVEIGRKLHFLLLQRGYEFDAYVHSTLVDMYGKCGCIREAIEVFNSSNCASIVSWNALLLGYVENGEAEVSLHLLSRMKLGGFQPDARTFVAAIKACTEIPESLEYGKILHLLASCSGYDVDNYVQETLVEMYSKHGLMENARAVFESMKHLNVLVWTELIMGYARNEESETSLGLFLRMREAGCLPGRRTILAALKACTSLALNNVGFVESGKMLHLLTLTYGFDDLHLETTLVNMFAKCGCMGDALNVFESMKQRNVVPWTVLMLGYTDSGNGGFALDLFLRMRQEGCAPDARVFVAVIKAFAAVAQDQRTFLEKGKALHFLVTASGFENVIYVEAVLIDMYAKCGSIEKSQEIFNKMNCRDTASWNALILGYLENGEAAMALERYACMKAQGYPPDVITYVGVLKACSIVGALDFGREVHAEICNAGLEHNLVVSNTLVAFYARCGSLVEAEEVFDTQQSTNLISWSALISGYKSNGDIKSVFAIFDKLHRKGIQPDGVTLNHILTACSHSGLVDDGKRYFEDLSSKYGIKPGLEHYTCMMDLFGRSNKLDDAMTILRSMPFSPDAVAWRTVLGACRKWNNVVLGRMAFESLVSLDGKESAAYVLVANL